MRKMIGFGLALVTGLVSTTAFAQEEEPAAPSTPAPAAASASTEGMGISLGLRAGYALPLGEGAKDRKMSDVYSGAIPFQLDALYHVTPNIGVGLYFSYGIVSLKNAPDGVSASWLKYGVQAQYRLNPGEATPWFGLGLGLESVTSSGGGGSSTISGIEFAHLMAGYDFKVADKLNVGPFADFSLGQYSSVEGNDIAEKAMHEWLFLGLRGTYDL